MIFNNDVPSINSVNYETPIGNFTARFDKLHEHHYPDAHSTAFGAKFRQEFDDGRVLIHDQQYNLNIQPPMGELQVPEHFQPHGSFDRF